MNWGGGGGNFLNEFYFMNIFFFKEAPENFFLEIALPKKNFLGEWPSNIFFPGEGPRFPLPPQIMNGRLLR